MQHCTHATTPSAVKLDTSAWEQQVDAPGQIALQKKMERKAKQLPNFLLFKKTKPINCSSYNSFNSTLTSQDALKWQPALRANGCTVKCLSHSSYGEKKRGNRSMSQLKVKTAGCWQLHEFIWPTTPANTATV